MLWLFSAVVCLIETTFSFFSMSPPRSKQPEDADYIDSTPQRQQKRGKRNTVIPAKILRHSRNTKKDYVLKEKEDKRYTWKSKLYSCNRIVRRRHELKERIDVQRVLLFEIMNHKPHLISADEVDLVCQGSIVCRKQYIWSF